LRVAGKKSIGHSAKGIGHNFKLFITPGKL
jgi:hypothetical protein